MRFRFSVCLIVIGFVFVLMVLHWLVVQAACHFFPVWRKLGRINKLLVTCQKEPYSQNLPYSRKPDSGAPIAYASVDISRKSGDADLFLNEKKRRKKNPPYLSPRGFPHTHTHTLCKKKGRPIHCDDLEAGSSGDRMMSLAGDR